MLVFISAIPHGGEMSDYFLVSYKVKEDAPSVEVIYTSVEEATTAVTAFFEMDVKSRYKFCQEIFNRDIPVLDEPEF